METSKPKRIQIFSPTWERVILLIGFLPLIFVAWDPGWMHTSWKLKIISDVLFLNVVHNAFSFYIIWRSDEVRRAIRNHYGNDWSLHLRAAAIFCVSFIFYYVFFFQLFPVPPFQFVALVSIQFLALQHALSQVHGLSRLYDNNLKTERNLTADELRRLRQAGLWERRFHRLALLGIGIRAVWVDHRAYSDSVDWNQISAWGRYLLIVGTVGLMATCFYRPYWRESNQWLFNLRRVWETIPAYFNPTYIALQRLNHGLEYLAVTAAMERNAKKRKSLVVAAGVFLAVVGIRVYFYIHQIIFRDTSTPFESFAFTDNLREWTYFLAVTSLSISIVHYYYDSQIFRFSKAEFRDDVLPLLAPIKPSSQRSTADPQPSRSSTM